MGNMRDTPRSASVVWVVGTVKEERAESVRERYPNRGIMSDMDRGRGVFLEQNYSEVYGLCLLYKLYHLVRKVGFGVTVPHHQEAPGFHVAHQVS